MSTPTLEEEDISTTCFACGKKVEDGHWFARLPFQSRRVIFCRPFCLELFLDQKEKHAARRAASFQTFVSGN